MTNVNAEESSPSPFGLTSSIHIIFFLFTPAFSHYLSAARLCTNYSVSPFKRRARKLVSRPFCAIFNFFFFLRDVCKSRFIARSRARELLLSKFAKFNFACRHRVTSSVSFRVAQSERGRYRFRGSKTLNFITNAKSAKAV